MTTDRATLLALAARVEAATDNRILRDVFITLHKAEIISDGQYDAAMRLLNAGASLDAAIRERDEARKALHERILHWQDATSQRDAANAARVAAEGPTQIAMGHGLVDVDIINPDGRYALTFRPRAHFIPVGQQHGKMGGSIEFAPGDVIIWLDGEEFGDTIINKLNEGRAYKAALTPAPEAPTDGE